MDMLGPWRKKTFRNRLYWDDWGNVFVLVSCADLTSIVSTVAVCLFAGHHVDAGYSHTLWYGYTLLLFQGLSLLPPVLCFFSQSFHYCWVFVVSAAFGGTQVTGALRNQGSYYGRRYAQLLSLHFGMDWGGVRWGLLALAGCAHLDFQWLTFGLQQVFQTFPTPPSSPMSVLQWLQPFFFF